MRQNVKPTQEPVPSSDIKNLFFNSGLLDIWATSLEPKYIDRFGNCHLTAAGMEWIFNELVTKFKIESEQALLAAGYAPAGTFQEGAEVVSRNGTVLWKLPDGDGDHYRWDGDLPKQVPAGSTPQSTGGIGKGAWVSVGDASLRGDIGIIVKRYNTVSSMINDLQLQSGITVETIGYHNIFDGGGNTYLIVAAGTGTHDGGSYIDLSGSGLQAKGLFRNRAVMPEMFGAIGGFNSGDTDKIQAANDFSYKSGYAFVGYGEYLLESTLNITANSSNFEIGGFKVSDSFPSDSAILIDKNSSEMAHHRIKVDGNKDNQVIDVTSCHVFAAGSLYDVVVYVKNASVGLKVSGNTERARFSVFSHMCNTVVMEEELGTGDVTPDEVTYYIADIGSQRYFKSETASACTIEFNTENSATTSPFPYLVDIGKTEGKPIVISGIMRTPRNNVIGISRESSAHFNNLVIFAPSGQPLKMSGDTVRNVTGTLYVREAVAGGCYIVPTTTPSNLSIYIDGFGKGAAVAFKGGSYLYSDFNIIASAPKDNSDYVDARGVLDANIQINANKGRSTGTSGIVMDGSRASFKISRSVLSENIPISFDSTQADIWIYGRGESNSVLTSYSTPIVGMKVPLGVGGTIAGYTVYTGRGSSGWQVPTLTDL
ncbi:hypothetical protein LHV25_21820 [Providencia rettgeri]|uniref:tail fiber/spike domain-containing protein n=1 Tax=Providencia rettgeri TaxID=587 RepID=UPI001B36BFBC|nr:hypothetical protein [Providencia rettgeri]MBQ0262601.1 hypothetical protein [Providencia rettgeri]MCB4857625.1 hypothetical protein [Providencia rettgeri]MCD6316954.1 hypothetical protein [Providencia rettgeri]